MAGSHKTMEAAGTLFLVASVEKEKVAAAAVDLVVAEEAVADEAGGRGFLFTAVDVGLVLAICSG